MATGGSGPGGMRILWIPGNRRKNQHKKGVYTSHKGDVKQQTNQRSSGQQLWSLGGSHQQRKLINTDFGDEKEGSSITTVLSHATNIMDPVTVAGAVTLGASATTSAAAKNHDVSENLDNHENSADEKITEKDILKNGDIGNNTDNIDIENDNLDDVDDKNSNSSYHNSATLAIRNRRKNKKGSNNSDLDSIEHLENDDKEHMGSFDDIDSVSMTLNRKQLPVPKKKKKNKKKKKEKIHDDDKLVNCLYYGLVCCDCTIS